MFSQFKMPTSLNQLIQRLEAASQTINDERSYIEEMHFREFTFTTDAFFASLGDVDLEQMKSTVDKAVKVFQPSTSSFTTRRVSSSINEKIEAKGKR